MTSALSLVDVTVAYGETVALDGLRLDVAPGEVVAIIGPSGSGKSTLLRAVAGLEPMVAGEIWAGGRSLAAVATHDRDLGLMFQDHALFPHRTVADNVAFGLEMQGVATVERNARVDALLALVGLAGFGPRSVTALSGGEAQRVALARALAPEPALLMLDEPFGSLDRVLREQLTTEVRALLSSLGQTALHVTHDQAEAFAMADRVAVLDQGRLLQVGEPEDLWREPATSFVATFVGHPNLWTVEVDGEGVAHLGTVALGPAPHLEPGRQVVVVPVPALVADPGGPLDVIVSSARFDQGRYRVEGRVDGTDETATVRVDQRPPPGRSLRMGLAVERLHPVDLPNQVTDG